MFGSNDHSLRRPSRTRLSIEHLEDRSLPSSTTGTIGFDQLAINEAIYDSTQIIVHLDDQSTVNRSTLQYLSPGLYTAPIQPGFSVAQALTYYQSLPGVLSVSPDYQVQVAQTPNDVHFNSLYGQNNYGQTGGTMDADIDAPEAWSISVGTGRTIVAVIDTGVDYNHPDLAANMWRNPGEVPGDGRDNDGNGYIDDIYGYDFANNDSDPMDEHGHGTHVAGTIGAVGNNGIGVTGVNWNAKIMALKFLRADGSGSMSDAVRALDYAARMGAKISNNSYTSSFYDPIMAAAVTNAEEAGHLFVAAAGNQRRNIDQLPTYPATLPSTNVLSVAATDKYDQIATFSNYGALSVDLAAPGVDILSTTRGGGYGYMSGTSMASPHVAGAAALVWDANPTLTYREVINKLLNGVDQVSSLTGKVATGGRLNVYNALRNSNPVPPPPPADTTGASITSLQFFGNNAADRTRARVTFSEAIDVSSFTASDILFTNPNGGSIAISNITAVAGSNNTQFDIGFATQTAIGTYRMILGPDIRDTAGNQMDQNANGTKGENPGDTYSASTTIVDSRGGAITGFQFVGTNAANRTGARVTFSEAMDPSSFTASDISFTGPNGGSITITGITPVAGSNNTQFDITFATQTAVGTYRMILGPDIRDAAGNALDQNNNGINGENPADTYSASTTIVDSRGGAITSVQFLGTSAANRTGARVTFSKSIDPSSFTASDISFTGPNGGSITITGITPVAGSNNTQFDITFATQTAVGTYQMILGPDIRDTAGNALDQNANGVNGENPGDTFTATTAIADTRGGMVTAFQFLGTNSRTGARVTFSEAMDPSSFSAADIIFTGPGGVLIPITGITPVAGSNNTQFDITFANQTAGGTYRMILGPDIRDTAGNQMDQNNNGVNGENPGDTYSTTTTIAGTFTYTNNTPVQTIDRGIITSKITVGENFSIRDLNVRLNIEHTNNSDLAITLIAPDGTRINLVNRRGGSGDNFTNTILDDEAGTAISRGRAPFNGSFRPEQVLSALDGKSIQGTWTLEIVDYPTSSLGATFGGGRVHTGTLRNWSLIVEAGVEAQAAGDGGTGSPGSTIASSLHGSNLNSTTAVADNFAWQVTNFRELTALGGKSQSSETNSVISASAGDNLFQASSSVKTNTALSTIKLAKNASKSVIIDESLWM